MIDFILQNDEILFLKVWVELDFGWMKRRLTCAFEMVYNKELSFD